MITKKVTVSTAGTLVQAATGSNTHRVKWMRLTTGANTNNVYWGQAGFTKNSTGCGGILPPSTSQTIEAFDAGFMLEELWFDADTNGNSVYLTVV